MFHQDSHTFNFPLVDEHTHIDLTSFTCGVRSLGPGFIKVCQLRWFFRLFVCLSWGLIGGGDFLPNSSLTKTAIVYGLLYERKESEKKQNVFLCQMCSGNFVRVQKWQLFSNNFCFRVKKKFSLCYIVIRSLGDSGRGCTINAIIPRNRASHVNVCLWI